MIYIIGSVPRAVREARVLFDSGGDRGKRVLTVLTRLRLVAVLSMMVLSTLAVLPADENKKPKESAERSADAGKEKVTCSKHSLTLDGVKLDYEATAGTLTVQEDDAKHKANMFFVAYTKSKVEDASRRPITFAFNGGPGSSSVWLHMGLLGPKRVDLGDGVSVAPPYRLVDNEATLLAQTDLVFIDPVTTGYSRAEPADEAKQYHGVTQDIRSVAEFVRLYVTKYRRWDSPKYLAGESYGTTRAAGLADHLQNQVGMNLNGIILISSILNFQTARFDDGNDLPYPLFLPTYTATAWYHQKLAPELLADRRKTLEEVEKFACGDYTLALMKGSAMTTEERQDIARKLARYTGLSEDYVRRANLRIEIQRFVKELLRDTHRTVGRYDSRFLGRDGDAAGEHASYDPSYTAVQGPYTALVQQYMAKDLHYVRETPYRILTGRVQPWDYGSARNRYLNVSSSLRQAMTRNPALRVFVANGYYDLATPYFATRYTFDHLDLDGDSRGRVRMAYYDAGHMMYIEKKSLHQLHKDLGAFLQDCAATQPASRR
jgi:carboxypeptidase C (cathepsin A)